MNNINRFIKQYCPVYVLKFVEDEKDRKNYGFIPTK